MEELITKLNSIPGSYFGFVAAITSYAKKKPERLQKVLDYLDASGNLSTSDVIRFISVQPDFYEFSAAPEEKVG